MSDTPRTILENSLSHRQAKKQQERFTCAAALGFTTISFYGASVPARLTVATPAEGLAIYDHRAWDAGAARYVYWTAAGAPELTPAATIPEATGQLLGACVIAVRAG